MAPATQAGGLSGGSSDLERKRTTEVPAVRCGGDTSEPLCNTEPVETKKRTSAPRGGGDTDEGSDGDLTLAELLSRHLARQPAEPDEPGAPEREHGQLAELDENVAGTGDETETHAATAAEGSQPSPGPCTAPSVRRKRLKRTWPPGTQTSAGPSSQRGPGLDEPASSPRGSAEASTCTRPVPALIRHWEAWGRPPEDKR